MKILYVEDELGRNLNRIIDFFGGVLEPKIKNKLKALSLEQAELELMIKEQGQEGIASYNENQEVEDIISKSTRLDVAYSFPSALNLIAEKYEDYDLFIIDRNLEKEEYSLEDLINISPNFTENLWGKYVSREGDFLLNNLISKIDCINKFYFLTANSSDVLKCQDELAGDIANNHFKISNILEKGNQADAEKLKLIIQDFKKGNFRIKMQEVFEIFEQELLSKNLEKELIKTIKSMHETGVVSIKDNFARIRRIQEGIYIAISKSSPEIIPTNLLKNDNGFLKMRPILKHLSGNWNFEQKRYNTKQWQDNIIAKQSDSVYSIASDNGSHTPYENPDYMPTKYSVQSAVYALCDILIWFKQTVTK